MILICQRCGADRHSRSRYCEDCASDFMRQRMLKAYRIATIVPRETFEPDAAEMAMGFSDQASAG
jgi:hypothetical protein